MWVLLATEWDLERLEKLGPLLTRTRDQTGSYSLNTFVVESLSGYQRWYSMMHDIRKKAQDGHVAKLQTLANEFIQNRNTRNDCMLVFPLSISSRKRPSK